MQAYNVLHCLGEVESMLHAIKMTNGWSVKETRQHVKKNGICLRNGVPYGKHLKSELKKNTSLIVKLNEVKKFKLCKMCLVRL